MTTRRDVLLGAGVLGIAGVATAATPGPRAPGGRLVREWDEEVPGPRAWAWVKGATWSSHRRPLGPRAGFTVRHVEVEVASLEDVVGVSGRDVRSEAGNRYHDWLSNGTLNLWSEADGPLGAGARPGDVESSAAILIDFARGRLANAIDVTELSRTATWRERIRDLRAEVPPSRVLHVRVEGPEGVKHAVGLGWPGMCAADLRWEVRSAAFLAG